jgi:autotransporter translocation and assembly factor TamB
VLWLRVAKAIMKRTILIIAIISLMLFAACWVYVQSDAFTLRIRPLIAGPLQDVLGPGANFGRIKANLLPLYLDVRDVTIPSSRNTDAIAIRRIRLYINPFPLIYKTISIPSIALIEPRIVANRSAEGDIDLAGLFREVRANIDRLGSSGKSSYDVQIRTITVRNAKLVFFDDGTRLKVLMQKINFNVKTSFPGNSMTMRLASSDITVSIPSYRDIAAHAHGIIAYDQGRLSFDSCELFEEDTKISLSGSLDALSTGDMDMKITSRLGQRSLRKYFDILTRGKRGKSPVIDASARITGRLQDPVMEGSIDLSGIAFKEILFQDAVVRTSYRNRTLSLKGEKWKLSRGKEQLNIHEIALDASHQDMRVALNHALIRADDAELNVSGNIGFPDGYALSIAGESSDRGRSLAFLTGIEMSGDIAVRGKLFGPLETPHFDGQLTARPMTIRGILFSGVDGKLVFDDRKLLLSEATIRQGISQYDFEGSVSFRAAEPFYQARIGISRSDVVSIVTLFYKRIPLEIVASGEMLFTGSSHTFTGNALLEVGPGVAYGETFDSGTLAVDLTNDRVSFPSVTLRRKGGKARGTGWIGFDGSYNAHVESDGLDLSQVNLLKGIPLSGPFLLDIRSSGSFSKPEVQAHLTVGELSYQRAALGAATADLNISEGLLSVTASVSNDLLDMSGTMKLKQTYPWSLSAKIHTDKFDPSTLYEGGDLLSKIRVKAEGTLQAQGNGFGLSNLNGSAVFRKLGFSLNDLLIENVDDAVVNIDAGRLFVQSLTLAGPGTKLSVTGDTRLGTDVDLTFTGDANLSLLRIFYRDIEHSDGTALVKLSVNDQWSNPEVAGELLIKDGQIKIKNIPQKFTALNGTISFDRNKVLTEGIRGEVGGGSITISGSAQLRGSALVDFSAKAAVENVTVRYPPGMTATLGGSLYYDGDPSSQTLSGEVGIRRAHYEKRVEWKSMLVDFSRGFTQKKKEDVGWIGDTLLNVRFFGKENILFESNLAKIQLDIDMMFQGTVSQPQLLGRIEARKGDVYFRQVVFRIIHASADFTDPGRINPTLDVQAETRVREYQIRLGVSGTADRATVTFVSDPALTDSNILALLALGKTSEELKGKEASVGVGEATSFATGKFQDILESRARSLTGLDRFQVDPYLSKTDMAVPRVTVGKAIVQDKLFMTYSSNVGASTPEQMFRIEYILNKNMSLIGQRDEVGNMGADVKFRFEFR